jgi:transcriptional regulator of arginine metabolism
MLRQFVRSIATAGPSLIVVKTTIGAAQSVAAAIDKAEWPEIVGTISGDDTIFLATDTARAQAQAVTRLRELFRG